MPGPCGLVHRGVNVTAVRATGRTSIERCARLPSSVSTAIS
ncbi:MAG: hypothetical protein ABL982_14800 [Vicinamibacterales bacterium]